MNLDCLEPFRNCHIIWERKRGEGGGGGLRVRLLIPSLRSNRSLIRKLRILIFHHRDVYLYTPY